ncbi:GYDIA family GHMP kinase [Flavobacterium qiangtangense]|uniref:GYDIA family GHMP kinase n=1 Tax=Flavobacterium qiangtangense TaxID=1442595 RepID=A0ABW1PQJ8_9FLAO
MKKTFYSNGKLFITGEYVVLDGGIAFSLPTKFGQNLIIEENNGDFLHWKSFDCNDKIWLEEKILISEIKNNSKNGNPAKDTLVEILHFASEMNGEILEKNSGFDVSTKLTFPRNWGLGSSSTLINNIAQWFEINAFELLNKSFGGSGYDIANAQNDTAILYQISGINPIVKPIDFSPEFAKNIFFVYLNQKQSSKEAIKSYREKKSEIGPIVEKIDSITKKALQANNFEEFGNLMKQHEATLSPVLEIKTVQERLFLDFDGVIKSLGAWGGDFVMVISEENPKDYFKQKGFDTILTYEEMIL